MGAGGTERVVSVLANAWIDNGWDVTIVSFEPGEAKTYHPLDARICQKRIDHGPRRIGKWHSIGRTLRRIKDLRTVIRRDRPDLVISFLTKINVCTLLASLNLKVPVVVCERNNPVRQEAHGLWWHLHRQLSRRAMLVLQTEASRTVLAQTRKQRVCTIPNPVETSPEANPSAANKIVAVGRLVPQKGFDLLLRAFAKIADDWPDWTLVIWGEGPLREELERERDRLGLRDRVEFPGLSSQPLGWLDSGSIFVLASLYEGFPNVLAEAMAAGLPVISFDCSWGPREMIIPEQDGLLVPTGDVDALARSIGTLIADPELRDRLGAAARQNVRRFSKRRIVDQWTDMIARLLPAAGTPYPLGADEQGITG
jgi:glycosyltransferase involved in cell wall biosynthesis